MSNKRDRIFGTQQVNLLTYLPVEQHLCAVYRHSMRLCVLDPTRAELASAATCSNQRLQCSVGLSSLREKPLLQLPGRSLPSSLSNNGLKGQPQSELLFLLFAAEASFSNGSASELLPQLSHRSLRLCTHTLGHTITPITSTTDLLQPTCCCCQFAQVRS